MSITMERALINAREYDKVIIRRKTVDGCVDEQELGVDGDKLITPRIEIALRPGVSRKYIFQETRLENRRQQNGGDELRCLVADYIEDI